MKPSPTSTPQPLYEDHRVVRVDVPYIPGFLAFREAPHVVALGAAPGALPGESPFGSAGGDVIDIEDGGGFAFVAAGHDGTTVDDEAWVVGAGEGHGKAGAVFVAVVEADDGVVAMGGADEFGAVGDYVAGGEGGVAAFVALGDVVTDGADAEGEADEAGFGAALFDELGEFVGVDVAEVAVEEGGADADLGFVEVLGGEAEAPVEGVDAALPAVGEGVGVPIQGAGRGVVVHRGQRSKVDGFCKVGASMDHS